MLQKNTAIYFGVLTRVMYKWYTGCIDAEVCMATKKPRINVTVNPNRLEVIKYICEKYHNSMSSMVNEMIDYWLEDHEDLALLKRIEEREDEDEISHEDFWKDDV